MDLPVIERAIEDCKAHLEKTGAKNTEIESYLTRFLLICICGEYEKAIKQMIVERARRAGDTELVSYIENTVETFKTTRICDIRKKILRRFSVDCQRVFDTKMGSGEAKERYENIVTNRHLCAHGEPINMTFEELELSYNQAKDVLSAISEALKVK